jgi:hypothetical protein
MDIKVNKDKEIINKIIFFIDLLALDLRNFSRFHRLI